MCVRGKLITWTVEVGGGECGRDGMAEVGRPTLDPSTVLRVSGPSAPGKATGRSPLQGGDAAPFHSPSRTECTTPGDGIRLGGRNGGWGLSVWLLDYDYPANLGYANLYRSVRGRAWFDGLERAL